MCCGCGEEADDLNLTLRWHAKRERDNFIM